MNPVIRLGNALYDLLDSVRAVDFLAPLTLRIYLAPIFLIAGFNKLTALDNTAQYFGDYLGLPAPFLMALLAGSAEFFGGIALILGLGLRLMVIPMMFTMIVAAATAHWDNGWHALPEATLTVPWEWRMDLIEGAQERKEAVRYLLSEHGNYRWLTETGGVTILKNGIEFAATYFAMLLVLLFTGAGRYVSADYWLALKWRQSAR